MRKAIFILGVLFCVLSVEAQNTKISGRVTDEKGETLAQATIVIDASKGQATVTDIEGRYELAIAAGTYQVAYRYLGKEEMKYTIALKEGQNYIQNVILRDNSKMMDQVVVTGSKYAKKLSEETVSMEVMKGSTLSNQNITSLETGLQKIPGVTVADGQANVRAGSGWSYGAGSRVAVLYDGLPITTADADDAKWSAIPMENIDQVEVIKGAGSALYGTGAENGIINAISAWPTDKPYTKFQLYSGFYGNPPEGDMRWWGKTPQYFSGFNVADRRKLGQFDLLSGAGITTDRGYLDSSDASDIHINEKLRWRIKKVPGLSIGVNAVVYYSWGKTFFAWDSLGHRAYEPLPNSITIYHDGRYMVDPFINYRDSKGNKFSFKYRYLNSSNINSTQQGSIGHRNYADLQYTRMMKKIDLNIVAGAVGMYDMINPPSGDTSSLYGRHNRADIGLYAQVDKKFFKKLTVNLGLRWEYFNVDHGFRTSIHDLKYPLVRLGLNYQMATATFIRGSFGQGFRFPSLAETFVSTNIGSLLYVYSNPALKPEKGYGGEVGFRQGFNFGKGSSWVGYADIAGFINLYDNMMEFTFGQFGPQSDPLYGLGLSSQNIGNTRILGTEVTAGLQGKIAQFKLGLLMGYTYVDARSLNWNDTLNFYDYKGNLIDRTASVVPNTYANTSTSDKNFLKYRSRHQFKLLLDLAYKFVDFNIDYQYLSYQENIDQAFVSDIFTSQSATFLSIKEWRANKEANGSKGDHIVNMGLGFTIIHKLKIAGIVKNVTNTEWMTRPGMFQAPRNYTLQISYTL